MILPIIYDKEKIVFKLDTPNSTYAIFITEENFLYHLYYGKKVSETDLLQSMEISPSFCSGTSENNINANLSAFNFEYTPFGLGNFDEPSFMVSDKNGNPTCDIRFKSYRIINGKPKLNGLPATFGSESEVTSLEIICEDKFTNLEISLKYSVFENLDVITRSVKFKNEGDSTLLIDRALSTNIALPPAEYDVISLPGNWARERNAERFPVHHGKAVLSSIEGKTSHGMNNFFAVCSKDATETQGDVWGNCLVYSGNFYCGTEKGGTDYVRMFSGINPDTFGWKLETGAEFQTPEVIHVYSANGLGEMSRTYHDLMRNHLMRGKWVAKDRPVLINNWEATYFDFDNQKLLEIAKEAKSLGVEMLVIDDGWFGHRNSDNSSLGDWFVFESKIKGGLKKLVDEINNMDMKVGLWFEPEMVSPDSELYKNHPDWCLHINGRERHTWRNQLVLDFSRKEVRDFIFNQMKKILSTVNIEYIKWDHNRSLSEVGNEIEEFYSQKSLYHKYVLGVYEIQERLITEFPDILLENCSGGGGRFDAGMLHYSPQIWTSDNTDAFSRLSIHYGTSLCYPISSFGAHVSAVPNHQTGRIISLKTRGDVAMCGTFGYELDVTKMSKQEKEEVKEQILEFKKYNHLSRNGDYYRIKNPDGCSDVAWQFVSKDKSETIATFVKVLQNPTMPKTFLKLKGLDENTIYCDQNKNTYSGSFLMNIGVEINTDWGDFNSVRLYFKKAD